MWYAGIDWADEHHDVLVIDEAGHQVGSRRVAHSPTGLAELTSFLGHIAPPEQMACILETNRGLLIAALLEAGFARSIRSIPKRWIAAAMPLEPKRMLLMHMCSRKPGEAIWQT